MTKIAAALTLILASILGSPTVLGSSMSAAGSQAQNWGTMQSSGSQNQFGLKLWG